MKAVAGEFSSLFQILKTSNDIGFIWITDGLGWNTAKNPIQEAFNNIDFIFNILMIENGLLEEVLVKEL